MNIRIKDRWLIKSGTKDFEVSEIKTVLDGKNKGNEILVDTAYVPSLEQALNNIFKRDMLKSDATTLIDLLNEIKGIRNELQILFDLNLEK